MSNALSQNSARWVQLALGVIVMMAVANLQYGWTLFVGPLDAAYGWGRPAIQFAFSIFIFVQAFLAPFEGRLIDRFGPGPLVVFAGMCIAASWITDAYASSRAVLYGAALVGGIGVGLAATAVYGNTLKWFGSQRGLAMGLAAAGYGIGVMFTVKPIAHLIETGGYRLAFYAFGLGLGVLVCIAGSLLRAPAFTALAVEGGRERRQYRALEMARTPTFWVIYALFLMVAMGGLTATAQLASIAKDYGISSEAVTMAIGLNALVNGLSRPFFGWLSDYLGRARAMALAFGLESIGVVLLLVYGVHDPVLFVALSAVVFFAWGEVFSLFPALCGDLYGRRYASENYGLLYTAKGIASLAVPLASVLMLWEGSWTAVFVCIAGLDLAAALAAFFVLQPLAARFQAK